LDIIVDAESPSPATNPVADSRDFSGGRSAGLQGGAGVRGERGEDEAIAGPGRVFDGLFGLIVAGADSLFMTSVLKTSMTGFAAFSSSSSSAATRRAGGSARRDCALNQTMFGRASICLSVTRAKLQLLQ